MLEVFHGQVVSDIGILKNATEDGAVVLVVEFVGGDRLDLYPADWEFSEDSQVIISDNLANAVTNIWEGIAVCSEPGQDHILAFKVSGVVHFMIHRGTDIGDFIPTQWKILATHEATAQLVSPYEYTVPSLKNWMG